MQDHKSSDTFDSDIIIIGAGSPGLCLAVLLSDLGLKISIIDINKPPSLSSQSSTARTSALMEGSVELLKKTGCWESCHKFGGDLETLKIIDSSHTSGTKETFIDFHSSEINLKRFAVNMPNDILHAALFEQAQSRDNIRFIIPGMLRNIIFDEFNAEVILDDATRIKGKLIIGSDGRNSVTRKIANIECSHKEYNQKAITAIIEHSNPHNNTSIEFHRAGGPFTMVPLPNNTSSIVWVENNKDADRFYSLSKNDFIESLHEHTHGYLGSIDLINGPEIWPLIGQTSNELTSHRVILLAEAAHVLHPLGAQGLNLSIKDVSALVSILQKALKTGQDIGSNIVLSQYKKERNADTLLRYKSVDSLNKLVTNAFPFSAHLRKAGILSLKNCEPIKHLAMRYGMTTDY
jgi:2-octaprenyl-6-methoxyphenol hydroxylase